MSVAQVKTLKPSDCFAQLRDPGIHAARLEIRVAQARLSHRSVVRNRRQRESFAAAFEALLKLAFLDVCRSQPQPANCLEAQVFEGDSVIEGTATIAQARIPLSKGIGRQAQNPERPASPPEIAACLEARKSAFSCLDRVT